MSDDDNLLDDELSTEGETEDGFDPDAEEEPTLDDLDDMSEPDWKE